MGNPSPQVRNRKAGDAPAASSAKQAGAGAGAAKSKASAAKGKQNAAQDRSFVKDAAKYSLLAVLLLAVMVLGPERGGQLLNFSPSGARVGRDVDRRAPVAAPSSLAKSCTGANANAKVVSVTFSDGPGLQLGSFLDGLKAASAQATFHFVPKVAKQFNEGPGLVARTATEGHAVGLRFDPSVDPTSLTDAALAKALADQSEELKALTGKYPAFVRYNYEQVDDRVLSVTKAMGMTATSFNLDVMDYKYDTNNPPGAAIHAAYYSAFDATPNTSFISVHSDLNNVTASLTQDLFMNVVARGYQIIPLTTCVGVEKAYRDSNTIPASLTGTSTSSSGSSGSSTSGSSNGIKTTSSSGSAATNSAQQSNNNNGAKSAAGSLKATVAAPAAAVLAVLAAMLLA
ncbi:chitin deacetylase [Blastocladiella emersonii ATCC 22665]|nr:chitin deacetylase [Blastocladiella emersonii ATCC 22665]